MHNEMLRIPILRCIFKSRLVGVRAIKLAEGDRIGNSTLRHGSLSVTTLLSRLDVPSTSASALDVLPRPLALGVTAFNVLALGAL